jgi:hypothetical protein
VFEERTDDAAAQLGVGRRTSRFNAARMYTQSVATFEDPRGGGIHMYNNRTSADDGDAVPAERAPQWRGRAAPIRDKEIPS